MKPTVADNRNPNLLILLVPVSELPSVAAEAAGSSPVVPAIVFNHTHSRAGHGLTPIPLSFRAPQTSKQKPASKESGAHFFQKCPAEINSNFFSALRAARFV